MAFIYISTTKSEDGLTVNVFGSNKKTQKAVKKALKTLTSELEIEKSLAKVLLSQEISNCLESKYTRYFNEEGSFVREIKASSSSIKEAINESVNDLLGFNEEKSEDNENEEFEPEDDNEDYQ